ncbi:hypothetical protein Pnap_4445 (plasmid) [Polaromonas naphthalenivorans CJ2]|uniref:Uncharacterized protein n=1 Tax=Polaromonas naphthalenivorans (strain CJ2) TaxID=365044 RepID=A1VVP4_POLNA|nr:hypothetical protein Pnap_4445 [Polaromonas naphthalenivorans CJ2]
MNFFVLSCLSLPRRLTLLPITCVHRIMELWNCRNTRNIEVGKPAEKPRQCWVLILRPDRFLPSCRHFLMDFEQCFPVKASHAAFSCFQDWDSIEGEICIQGKKAHK